MVVVTQTDRFGSRYRFRGAQPGVWIGVAAALARMARSDRAVETKNPTPPSRATTIGASVNSQAKFRRPALIFGSTSAIDHGIRRVDEAAGTPTAANQLIDKGARMVSHLP
jgi:hypothetical protein